MIVNVYGSSYFAWVAAAKLAEKNHQVRIFASAVDKSVSGFSPECEAGLPELLEQQVARGQLHIVDGVLDDRTADLHVVGYESAEAGLAERVFPLLQSHESSLHLLVLTPLPPGAIVEFTHLLKTLSADSGASWWPHVALLPLFTREGTALTDFERPRLFLLGSDDEQITARVMAVMQPFALQASQAMTVPVATAELIRFGINAMLATRMSFMNEMAALAEKLGVDIELVRRGMAADPRVGTDYLSPGCGFGGPSFASELFDFAKTIHEEVDTVGLIDAVLRINESQCEVLFRKLWRYYKGDLKGRRVAVWGAAFKAGTPSVRNSVVHPLLSALWGQGCHTVVFDPQAMPSLRQMYPDEPLLSFSSSVTQSVQGVDAIALVTAWDEFRSPDFTALGQTMKSAIIFDGRNLYDPDLMEAQGFQYFGIGRGESI
ncbi:MAG TPA: nucleotide sugar dehydrogenase [Moraxellaceae bacterium]|nr:nucleotide sugar dehydrogenase [Moraxellaceae bacterium]